MARSKAGQDSKNNRVEEHREENGAASKQDTKGAREKRNRKNEDMRVSEEKGALAATPSVTVHPTLPATVTDSHGSAGCPSKVSANMLALEQDAVARCEVLFSKATEELLECRRRTIESIRGVFSAMRLNSDSNGVVQSVDVSSVKVVNPSLRRNTKAPTVEKSEKNEARGAVVAGTPACFPTDAREPDVIVTTVTVVDKKTAAPERKSRYGNPNRAVAQETGAKDKTPAAEHPATVHVTTEFKTASSSNNRSRPTTTKQYREGGQKSDKLREGGGDLDRISPHEYVMRSLNLHIGDGSPSNAPARNEEKV